MRKIKASQHDLDLLKLLVKAQENVIINSPEARQLWLDHSNIKKIDKWPEPQT